MNNKKYIKVEYNDYGYEIYAVNGKKTTKFRQQQKIVMHKLVRKFRCIKQDDNVFIYPNYYWIMFHFAKEKNNSLPKKVNRQKSKQIISGVLITATIIGGAIVIKSCEKGDDSPSITVEQPETTAPTIDVSDIIAINPIIPEVPVFPQTPSEPTETAPPSDEFEETEHINEFCYEFDKPNDKEALINSQNYMELFYKYEQMYGVDANLLCAIGAQESSGIHRSESTNGGYATGLMGIEYVWDNEQLRVFNFETNSYETIVVDYSRIGELEYNVQIGAAIFQNYFYHTLKNSESIEETDYLAFSLQKYNMGPGNMRKILAAGENWADNRDVINAGDKYYFEHVLSRFDNDTIIKLRLIDGSYYNTRLTNLSLEEERGRN